MSIRDFVFDMLLFDGHEHLLSLPELEADTDTYRSFAGYASADLNVSLGPVKPGKSALPLEYGADYDKAFFSAWRKSRNTGYCRAIERACRDILGLEYRLENADEIGNKLADLKKEGARSFMKRLLQERANIYRIINDFINVPSQIGEELFPSFVQTNYRDDLLLVALNRDTIMEREARWKCSIVTLDDLINGFMQSITDCLATGKTTSLKIGVAYNRGLDFGYPSKYEAEQVFNRMIYVEKGEKVLRWYERLDKKSGEDIAIPLLSGAELRPLHDYLLHTYIQRANDEDIPVQIHTGYLAGIQRDLRNINPMQLIPLLLRYRNTRFELFHAGWPYTEEMGAIGKNYPNVWISLCWAWTMNPIAIERALDSWLDCVPYNKIIGFGGDAKHPLAVYGYAIQAREGLARVFEKRIERGDMDEVLAKDAARAIMLTNGCELHGVPLPEAS